MIEEDQVYRSQEYKAAIRHFVCCSECQNDISHRGAMWGICFLGVPKTQKSSQPGAHFMSKPPDNPQVKPSPNRVG